MAIDGRIYMLGGRIGDTDQKRAHYYSVVSDTWANMPSSLSATSRVI